MYAIVSALKKYSGWIGGQPVLVVTDHKSIEQWTTETWQHQLVQQVDKQGGTNFYLTST
jgi:hypothetical protein